MALDDTERTELRDAARRLLTNESSLESVRRLLDDADGFDRRLWRQMAELGWLAIHVPEALGGLGASYTDVAVVLHELDVPRMDDRGCQDARLPGAPAELPQVRLGPLPTAAAADRLDPAELCRNFPRPPAS